MLAGSLLVTAATAQATQSQCLGYLSSPSMSPGHILRPSGVLLDSTPTPGGALDLTWKVHWANVWSYKEDRYLIDGEWFRFNTRIQYGADESFTLGVMIPFMSRSGGFADGSIERFHDTFGLDNADRERHPRNRSLAWVRGHDGTERILMEGNSSGIGDVALFSILRMQDLWASPSIVLQFTIPTGNEDELEGLGAPSVSIAAAAAKPIASSPVHAFAGAGLFYCPQTDLAGIEMRRYTYTALLGLEYVCSPSVSLVLQLLRNSPMAEDFEEFSKPSYELSAGVKGKIGDATVVEFAIIENLFTFKNSADIAAHLSIGVRL